MSPNKVVAAIGLVYILRVVLDPTALYAQTSIDPKGDARRGAPAWTDILKFSASQELKSLSFIIETADSIPKHVSDSCHFQILLQTRQTVTSPGQSNPRSMSIIAFDLSTWDGSPWFATNFYSRFDSSGIPRDTTRVFDWKLVGNSFKVRFSLESLGWAVVAARARIFYGTGIADSAPDTGWVTVTISQAGLQSLKTRSGARSSFTYPVGFDSLIVGYDVLKLVDGAYVYESDLTGIVPVGGAVTRFIFNPFYGGAAIEGDPIYLGPGMWGKAPLWFVYFHEMGHNFVNASARFRQLYPLEMKLIPGPLPTHILFYEAWASLPAMYVYDAIDRKGKQSGVSDSAVQNVLKEWRATESRFRKAWEVYKSKPASAPLDPDVVDGMFLELKDRFGWDVFRRFFVLMRPANSTLPLFNERLPGDSADLRTTRFTFTAAAFGASADSDLRKDFKAWGFPIDDGLYGRATGELVPLLK